MQTRELVAYLLLALLVAGAAFVAWRMIYNSEENVRRRNRKERRERRKAERAVREANKDGTGASD
jgi:hypothetical protein